MANLRNKADALRNTNSLIVTDLTADISGKKVYQLSTDKGKFLIGFKTYDKLESSGNLKDSTENDNDFIITGHKIVNINGKNWVVGENANSSDFNFGS